MLVQPATADLPTADEAESSATVTTNRLDTFTFNAAHPAGWAMFVNPRTHTATHRAFTNPATYVQFMQPGFYVQFVNPANWMAWFNPASYATFLDPNTYLYWMTPKAYVHGLDPRHYLQALDGRNYAAFFDAGTYLAWFDVDAYDITTDPAGTVGGDAGVDAFAALGRWFNSALGTDRNGSPAR